MAINNGNADFNLVAFQSPYNQKSIYIRFKLENAIVGQNPVIVSVNGGRGAF
jgi:hypothetical protein